MVILTVISLGFGCDALGGTCDLSSEDEEENEDLKEVEQADSVDSLLDPDVSLSKRVPLFWSRDGIFDC